MQQDATLSDILTCRTELEQVLDQLCGIGRSREPDDAVRGALAEATLMLVRLDALDDLDAPKPQLAGLEI